MLTEEVYTVLGEIESLLEKTVNFACCLQTVSELSINLGFGGRHNIKPESIGFLVGHHAEDILGTLNDMQDRVDGVKLTDSAHVKDLLALLRLAVNAEDRHALGRVLMLLKGIGPKTAENLIKAGMPAFKAQDVKRPGLAFLADTIDMLQLAATTPSAAFAAALDWYHPHLERLHQDSARRLADLEQIAQQIAGYTSLRKVLDDFALESAKEVPDKGVTLATIHWAKGREWPHVIVIGLAEGRFPSSRAETAGEYEEERRMLYVAATRAAARLELTAPASCLAPDRTYRAVGISSLLAHVPAEILPVWPMQVKSAPAGIVKLRVSCAVLCNAVARAV